MIKLKSLHLENCQSWKDGTIEFGPGLNAIIAGNNVGKSVIFKIIKITCNPDFFTKQERVKLIRYGSDFARATFTFSDDTEAITLITDKKVMYEFRNKNGETFYSEEEPLNQTLEHLSVIVEDNSKYLVNVLDSEQSLLLVKSDKKANSDLMKVITEHKGIERLTELFNIKLKYYSSEGIELKKKFERVNYKIQELDHSDLDMMQDRFNTMKSLDGLLEILETIERYKNDIEDNVNDKEVPDWSVFVKLLNQVQFIEKPHELKWGSVLKLLQKLPAEKLNQTNDINWETVIKLLNALPDYNIKTVENPLPLNEIKRLLNCYKDVSTKKIDTFSGLKLLVKIKNVCDELTDNLNRLDVIHNKITEIKKIDFNGTVYDCPVHGKIVYRDGKCEVAKHE